MVKKKSKLLAALDAHKGRDYEAERQKKLQKLAEKRKRLKATKETSEEEYDEKNENTASSAVNGLNSEVRTESEGWESDESEAAEGATIEVSGILSDESDSDSSIDAPNGAPLNGTPPDDEAIEMTENAGDIGTEDVPFSDIESLNSEEKADVLPYQRLTINNTTALLKAHKSIALPYTTLPFSAHQVVTTSEPVSIPDVHDDLNRELAFYKQCLSAAESGRAALKKEGVPFTRPPDYFAEMVKSEDQMGRVKQKIVDQAASKKAASEARRQRDLRKFGKQVQVAKLQERSKAKRAALEKIEVLKRKRKNIDTGLTNEEDLFDVALENETSSGNPSRSRSSARTRDHANPAAKRRKKDEKFGFGGKKRFAKSNDAVSTGDLKGFSTRKMKGNGKGKARLGKSRRQKQA